MSDKKAVNIAELRRMREAGEKIACLTCYDASFALVEDRAGVDVVLVGDSLGMVLHGGATTTPVTVDHIVYHSQVCGAAPEARFPGRRHAVSVLRHAGPRARCQRSG